MAARKRRAEEHEDAQPGRSSLEPAAGLEADGESAEPAAPEESERGARESPPQASAALQAARAAAIAAAKAVPGKAEGGAKSGAAKKRGPGRPPSKPPAPALVKKGIVEDPDDPDNRLEFVYGDPSVFKALFAYYKNIKARDIYMRCSPQGITFFTRDHNKISRVVANVAGDHVNWHYCAEEFWLGINREVVERMFASIDKSFYKITILQRIEDPETLHFVFKDAGVEKECNYKIAVARLEPDLELFDAEKVLRSETLQTDFPIEFTLTAKQFKKTVTDASSYSDHINIEKIGSHPLQLSYQRVNVDYHEVYRSPEKIQLRADVDPGRNFRCTVKLGNVKSLATSMVTDDVRVLARETDYILFCSAIDEKALVVNTLTNLA